MKEASLPSKKEFIDIIHGIVISINCYLEEDFTMQSGLDYVNAKHISRLLERLIEAFCSENAVMVEILIAQLNYELKFKIKGRE